MKKIFTLSLLAFALCTSCCQEKNESKKPESSLMVDAKLWSSAYQQQAAEYKALCFQAYNVARLSLNETLQKQSDKAIAIITDVDETVLDNSPNSVFQGLQGKGYESESWKKWTAMATADTLAGAQSFFSYAASHGVTIFYVTNRSEEEVDGTLKNLKDYGFPFADEAHIFPRTTTSDKSERRNKILDNYEVALYIGDNLGDFSHEYDNKPSAERNATVQQDAHQFGKKYIVLPNFNYGGWEKAFYNNSYKWTDVQKDSLVKALLKSY